MVFVARNCRCRPRFHLGQAKRQARGPKRCPTGRYHQGQGGQEGEGDQQEGQQGGFLAVDRRFTGSATTETDRELSLPPLTIHPAAHRRCYRPQGLQAADEGRQDRWSLKN
jgi:hypothetical protein